MTSTALPAPLLALVPWAAFLLTMELAQPSILGLLSAAIPYLCFVALPSAAPIAVVRSATARLVVTALMTVVAVGAAYAIITTDDAQAGLAVLVVPYVALPMAAGLALVRAFARWIFDPS